MDLPMTDVVAYDKYRVCIMKGNEVVQKLGVPAKRSVFRVVEVAHHEMSRVSRATHALIRGLDGHEITLYADDGWVRSKVKAMKLK